MLKSLYKKSMIGALLLSSTCSVMPIVVKSCLMVHPQTKKNVVLLDEAHASYLKMNADAQHLKMLSKLYAAQKRIFTALSHALLNIDSKKGAQTIVITETSENSFGCLVEQEAGAASVKDSEETLEILPRMFLRHLFASGTTVDARLEIFKNAIKPFNNINTASFVLKNNVRWIAGDRRRTKQDAYLSFSIYNQWEAIIEDIESGNDEELPKELTELTIGYVKGYINTLHAEFEQLAIIDPYYKKISDVINTALATEEVEESDHFALLHKHLLESGDDTIRDEFNNNMLSFISQKFDAELFVYVNAFEADEGLNCAFIVAGGAHNKQVKAFLLAKGYTIAEQAGVEYDALLDASCLEDRSKITALLEAIAANSPFVKMKEIVGVDIEKVHNSYSKHFFRAASLVGGALGALYFWNNQQKNWAFASAILGALIAVAMPQD